LYFDPCIDSRFAYLTQICLHCEKFHASYFYVIRSHQVSKNTHLPTHSLKKNFYFRFPIHRIYSRINSCPAIRFCPVSFYAAWWKSLHRGLKSSGKKFREFKMRLISREKTFTNTQNLRKKINKSVHSLRFNSFTTAQGEFDLFNYNFRRFSSFS